MREVKPLGWRFFWVKSTGNIVAQRREMAAGIESTKEEDFEVYAELSGLNPNAIEMTTFEPGQYEEDFARATDWLFDPETGLIQFIFSDPENPEVPTLPQPPLTEQVVDLQTMLAEQERGLMETSMLLADEQAKTARNEQAIMELSVLVAGGVA